MLEETPCVWILAADELNLVSDMIERYSNSEKIPCSSLKLIQPDFGNNKRVAFQQGAFTKIELMIPHDIWEDHEV